MPSAPVAARPARSGWRPSPSAKPKRRRDWAAEAAKLTGARKAKAPSGAFEPQLARLGDAPPEGEQWLHELKWDGYRILATMAKQRVQLWSRNALEWTQKLPDIASAIEALGVDAIALDGELIAGQGRKEDFNLLQATLSGERAGRLVLTLFDLLHVDGIDISAAPLRERKALLQKLLDNQRSPHLAFSSHIDADGAAAYQLAGEQHFEGIISKRADRAYQPGRSDDWRKTKQLASDEFAVVGYTAPRGSRSGFGSLLLARPDPEHGWRYVGRVGTGFTDAMLAEISARIGKAGGSKPTAYVGTTDTDLRHATWFAPRFVVEVFYRGVGRQDLLRQPSLKAVREDKKVSDLKDSDRDVASAPKSRKGAKAAKAAAAPVSKPAKRSRKLAESKLPTLSSPGKVLYPDDGITKQQVWDYYRAVMPHLLPEIIDRPLSIIRCPAGTGRPCFFQKHHTAGLERVDSVKLKEEGGNEAWYLVARDQAAVMELVQFNALEFHPWGANAEHPDRADRVVFDLDPGPDVPFAEVRSCCHRHPQAAGATGTGVVPAGLRWQGTARGGAAQPRFAIGRWSSALRMALPTHWPSPSRIASCPPPASACAPSAFSSTHLRNGRGAAAVASYSLRARAGAPVAMPLAWSQLPKLQRADVFTMDKALASFAPPPH